MPAANDHQLLMHAVGHERELRPNHSFSPPNLCLLFGKIACDALAQTAKTEEEITSPQKTRPGGNNSPLRRD
jgi:hypothetical protein